MYGKSNSWKNHKISNDIVYVMIQGIWLIFIW